MYCVATVIALISALELAFLIPLSNAHCAIDLQQDLPRKDPTFFSLTDNNELLLPVEGFLSFPTNGGAVITCSGKDNTNFIVLGTQTTNRYASRITCISGKTFRSDLDPTREYHVNQLSCKDKNYGSVEITEIPCAEGGQFVLIGFWNVDRQLVPFIRVCYDFLSQSAIYSQHVVYGSAISGKYIRPENPKIEFRKTFETINVLSYKKTNEIIQFTNLLGSAELTAKYVDTSSSSEKYLARGHLTPDADGIFLSWQYATYHYVNAVPTWQKVNNGNWKRIENVVRLYADKQQENLQIFTGTYGTLELRDINNNLQAITLEANRIRVPKWLWKIVKSTRTNAAIAFVTLNNVTRSPDTRLLCTDICGTAKWAQTQFSDDRKGFTYCCNVNELVGIIPHDAFAPNVLNYD